VKLGTLLLRNAAIGLSQLEAALRNQVLYGGRLGTNLVELGFIDLELLSSYLSDLTGFPTATPTLLDGADKALIDRLGADEAHRLRAIPLGYLDTDKDTIAIAMVDPTDAALDDLRAAFLNTMIKPYVVPELRALYYLEKHFGLPRRARFIRTARAGSEPAATDDRRRQQPAQGMVMPPAFRLEPRRKRSTSQVNPIEGIPTSVTYGAACERIDTARDRNAIADAFTEYAKGRCDALVVFLIRDGNALGWRGYASPPARLEKPIEQLSLPLGGASALQSAHDAGQTFLGAPPSAAHPVETQLWAALHVAPEPVAVLVVPVLVKQRAVNLIYAHTLGGQPPRQLVTELEDLATRAQTSYTRLIRQARGS
jgi:Type II secretion system (T2SS), protein E, N-terminal domain